MDYVEGKTLLQLGFPDAPQWEGRANNLKKNIYKQIGDVYAQLRRLELPEIGALGLRNQARTHSAQSSTASMGANGDDSGDTRACTGPVDVDSIAVCHRPMPVEILQQEVEGREPSRFFPPRKTFKTAREYTEALMSLARNNVDKAADNWLDRSDPHLYIYGIHDFQRYVATEWLDDSLDKGPFVLMHGDLSFHAGNLLWDDDHNLIAVLDWERSYAVPLQHFVPPLWLVGFYGVAGLVRKRFAWNTEARRLRREVELHEKALGLEPRLSADWEKAESFPHVIMALSLLQPDTVAEAYWQFLSLHISGFAPDYEMSFEEHDKIMWSRMDAFFNETPDAEALVARKVEDQKKFGEEWEKYMEETGDMPAACQCIGCKHERPPRSA